MNSVELDKYVRDTLLAPLEEDFHTLPAVKQLAVCLMSLERIYTSYFMKSDKAGAKYFRRILEELENAAAGSGEETISGKELDKLAAWCKRCVDRWTDGKFTGWKQYAVEILFPDHICPFTESLDSICIQKDPAEFGDIYQIGVELCELYEQDFQNQTEADQETLAEYIAAQHEDVAAVRQKSLNTLKLYREKKVAQKEYFQTLDDLEAACDRYPEDKQRYWELRNGHCPKAPEDMTLVHKEAERIRSDILFLKQSEEIPNGALLERLKMYRQLDILQ